MRYKHWSKSDADSECRKFSKLVVVGATATQLKVMNCSRKKSSSHKFEGDLYPQFCRICGKRTTNLC